MNEKLMHKVSIMVSEILGFLRGFEAGLDGNYYALIDVLEEFNRLRVEVEKEEGLK